MKDAKPQPMKTMAPLALLASLSRDETGPRTCEGTKRDGSSCRASARPGSTFCKFHEDGTGAGLYAIETGRSPYDPPAPAPERPGILFSEEDLEEGPAPVACPCTSTEIRSGGR